MAITEKDRKKQLDEAFPSEIQGYVRPSEGIETDFPYSENFPAFIAKDKVVYNLINLLLRQMLSNDKLLNEAIANLTERLAANDLELASTVMKGLMSAADKRKLDGIAENANNYTHPESGVYSGTYRSVTVNKQGHVTGGTNPTTLSGYGITDAAKLVHGNHVPNSESASNKRFLRNDNSWQNVTPSGIGAADINHSHDDRYYTESETNNLLGSKANSSHSHDERYYTESEVNNLLNGKTNNGHTHDDRYYTEGETNSLLAGKSNINHSHDDRYYTEGEVNNLLAEKIKTVTGTKISAITALVDWSAMAATVGASDVRNLNNTTTGIKAYGGDNKGNLNIGDIILKQSFKNFDKILVFGTNDDANLIYSVIWEAWELDFALKNAWRVPLFKNNDPCWLVYGSVKQGTNTQRVSTDTRFNCQDQNSGVVEIYGLTY